MGRRYGYCWAKLIGALGVLGAWLVGFVWVGDSWWQLLSAGVLAVIMTQVAFMGHDAAHRQMFKSDRWDDRVSLIVASLLVGLSYGWWQSKHTRHHANPNKDGSDPDIALTAIAFTPERATRHRGPMMRWLVAHQGWYFFPILRLGGVLTPEKAAAVLAVQLAVFGLYIGSSFAPNHIGMPLVSPRLKLDFLRRRVLVSRNISGGTPMSIFMGGLNYQIELHLFPSMARPHLRKIQPLVAAYCAAEGVPYTQTSLWSAYRTVIGCLNTVGLKGKDPFLRPLVAHRRAP